MIEYEFIRDGKTAVLLDRKRVGSIVKEEKGWVYRTTGGKYHGEWFTTEAACRASLEDR